MKDAANLHLKVQELCNCFTTTDPLKEMSAITADQNPEDAALKWLALAALHGVNSNAQKITLKESSDGGISVTAEYRESTLPSPGEAIGKKVLEAIREITHIESDKGKTSLALGLGDSSIELTVKIKDKNDSRKVSIEF
jgi:hypothetical protein